MVVRTFLYDTAGGPDALPGRFDAAAFAPLADRLWAAAQRAGAGAVAGRETYPTSQDAVEQLYATGEISAFFTYGPGTVASKVADGAFPASTRATAVPALGNIANTSFLAIPADAADRAAALVLANLLQDPETQLRFYADAGIFPVVAPRPADARDTSRGSMRSSLGPIGAARSPTLTARSLPELSTAYVEAVEDGWTAQVLQR